jgi:hypothetical protein
MFTIFKRKLLVYNLLFMSSDDILSCENTLKPKNCEGYDIILMRIKVGLHERQLRGETVK